MTYHWKENLGTLCSIRNRNPSALFSPFCLPLYLWRFPCTKQKYLNFSLLLSTTSMSTQSVSSLLSLYNLHANQISFIFSSLYRPLFLLPPISLSLYLPNHTPLSLSPPVNLPPLSHPSPTIPTLPSHLHSIVQHFTGWVQAEVVHRRDLRFSPSVLCWPVNLQHVVRELLTKH